MKFKNVILFAVYRRTLNSMKVIPPLYKLFKLLLSLVHVLPVVGIFMPKHVVLLAVLLYVYDIVHLVGYSKRICVQ
jgi:hypothetical protein